jgi:hypothetical protein
MLKKEQATRDAVTRRLSTVEAELSAVRQVKALLRPSRDKHRKTTLKSVGRVKAPTAKRKVSKSLKTRVQRGR